MTEATILGTATQHTALGVIERASLRPGEPRYDDEVPDMVVVLTLRIADGLVGLFEVKANVTAVRALAHMIAEAKCADFAGLVGCPVRIWQTAPGLAGRIAGVRVLTEVVL